MSKNELNAQQKDLLDIIKRTNKRGLYLCSNTLKHGWYNTARALERRGLIEIGWGDGFRCEDECDCTESSVCNTRAISMAGWIREYSGTKGYKS